MRIFQLRAHALGVGLAAGAVLIGPANASLSISKAPTQNVACENARCVATAAEAVLNVEDLHYLLADDPSVSVQAGTARNMTIDAPLTWTRSNTLGLSARGQITVNKPVTATARATMNIQSGGLVYARGASLTFWDVASSLTINGDRYTLIGDLDTLRLDLDYPRGQGFYALAKDCSPSGSFSGIGSFVGVFDGLGHTISRLVINGIEAGGMFDWNGGTIRNLNLPNVSFNPSGAYVGLLADRNNGIIDRVSVTGTLNTGYGAGGLVGFNGGTITNSHARAKITGAWGLGGLVAYNAGMISTSYAEGELHSIFWQGEGVGGLVGYNADGRYGQPGKIENSYARVVLHGTYSTNNYGGLVGRTAFHSSIVNSYAAGKIKISQRNGAHPGGVTGHIRHPVNLSNDYWDLNLGVHDPHTGAGNIPDQPGIVGLTGAQLKSGLPAGFNPKIWAQNAAINDGYPYLRNNPPK